MAIEYCNLTTDLTNAYFDIAKYKGYSLLSGFELHSGTIYKLEQSGHIEALFEDGTALTEVASLVAVDAASKWFYDGTNDILYVWCSDDGAPSTHTMEKGVDWESFKATCRNDAQEMLEGWLRSNFVTPFRPITAPRESYNARKYDHYIIRCTALLTCYLIIRRLNPLDSVADALFKEVINPTPEPGEVLGIVDNIMSGDITMKIQRSIREPGSFNVYEYSGNSANAYFEVTGVYTGARKEYWRVQIDGAGAPGTATYKISDDGGSTWDATEQETLIAGSEDVVRISIGKGIYVEFIGTFSEGDYIDIELFPSTDVAAISQIKTTRVYR